MNVVGLAGGLNRPDRNAYQFPWFFHDSAAVLVQSGQVVFALEEERINRIKHTTCFPTQAIKAAMRHADLTPDRVDRFAYFFSEHYIDNALQMYHHTHPDLGAVEPVRTLIGKEFSESFPSLGENVAQSLADRIEFVDHHLSHAASAWYPSGFDSALVMVIDGLGENVSVTLYDASDRGLQVLTSFGVSDSLGLLYLVVTEHLGYSIFDEYKVMGLAPYGDSDRFSHQFDRVVSLGSNGQYEVDRKQAQKLLDSICAKREKSDSFDQIHRDLAAAIQLTIEKVIAHLARHWQSETGHRCLAMAGGVAHNCTNNGRMLMAGPFDQIFVQPASHDAGCALGAALHVDKIHSGAGYVSAAARPIPTPIYVGRDVGDANAIHERLCHWQSLIKWHKPDNLMQLTAQRLAAGEVAGWVQGRAEFGPRALGNRSIVADPRPVSNKDRVNLMVKKREAYRPFAPAVLVDSLARFYEPTHATADLSHMTYALQTRADYVETLGAVTHVNGSARVQTVSQASNAKFYELIKAFGELTDVPVLLNTSFNNNVEPIVDSIDDALTCFLTTGLNFLVIGEYVIDRNADTKSQLGDFGVSLFDHVELLAGPDSQSSKDWYLQNRFSGLSTQISSGLARILQPGIGAAINQHPNFPANDQANELLNELYAIWDQRLVRLHASSSIGHSGATYRGKTLGQEHLAS